MLIIKIQNGGREGEEEGEGEGKVKLQRTLNLVGSQFASLRFPSFTLLHGTVIQWRLCLMHSTVSAAVVNVTSQPTAAATATVTATPTATGLNRRLRPEAETSSDYKCNYRGSRSVRETAKTVVLALGFNIQMVNEPKAIVRGMNARRKNATTTKN